MNDQRTNRAKKNKGGTALLRSRVNWLLAGLPLSAATARAQTASDTSAIYSGIAFSVASLVVLILAGVLVRRFSSRRKNDLAEGAGLDLMTLRQKNLLTPDEMKMVSAAIARRMAEKDARQKQASAGLSTATLMHDPEVLRLQELARAKKDAESRGPAPATETASMESAPGPAPGAVVNPEQGYAGGDTPATVAPAVSAEPQRSDDAHVNAGDPIGLGDPIDLQDYARGRGDAVELPPEVQKLADAGLLTKEEVDNIRRRIMEQ